MKLTIGSRELAVEPPDEMPPVWALRDLVGGDCRSGRIMRADVLPSTKAKPTDAEVDGAAGG